MPGTAIFDLDKTITRKGTWSRFVRSAVSPARFRAGLPAVAVTAAAYKLGLASRGAVKEKAIAIFLEGRSRDELTSLAETFVAKDIANGLRRKAREVIDAHKAAGDRLVIASAAVDLIVEPMARALGFGDTICTRLRWDANDRLLAELDGENCYGEEKLALVKARFEGTELARPVTFYSDHVTDLPCLTWADRGIAVNPNPPLRARAPSLGIEIADWDG